MWPPSASRMVVVLGDFRYKGAGGAQKKCVTSLCAPVVGIMYHLSSGKVTDPTYTVLYLQV